MEQRDHAVSTPEMSRAEWMKTLGCALYTRVHLQLLDEIKDVVPAAAKSDNVSPGSYWYETGVLMPDEIIAQEPAASSLYFAAQKVRELVPSFHAGQDRQIWDKFNISAETRDTAAQYAVSGGFVNPEFTHVFAPALANEVVDAHIAAGNLTKEDKDNFTLKDWANIIGSGWFASLAERMAFAGFGGYGPYGSSLQSMQTGPDGALARQLKRSGILPADFNQPLLQAEVKEDPEDDSLHLAATLTAPLRGALHASMADQNRYAGCPVARRHLKIPREVAAASSDIQHLIAQGVFAEMPGSTSETLHLYQEWTAIDITLAQIAHHLDVYETQYGVPQAHVEDKEIVITHSS